MKHVLDFISYFSILLNATYLSLVFYVSEKYKDLPYSEAKGKFHSLMPLSYTVTIIILVLLTIISLIVLARKPTVLPKYWRNCKDFLSWYISCTICKQHLAHRI